MSVSFGEIIAARPILSGASSARAVAGPAIAASSSEIFRTCFTIRSSSWGWTWSAARREPASFGGAVDRRARDVQRALRGGRGLDPEVADDLLEPRRLLGEVGGGRGELLGGRRVLLGDAVDALHRLAHARDALRLVLRGGGDLLHERGGVADRGDERGEELSRALRHVHAGRGELRDLLRGRLAALRELADLGGDDGEPPAVRPGAGRLDRSVQRE